MIVHYKGNKININENLLDKQDCWQNLKGILETRIKINTLLAMEEDDIRHHRLTKEIAKKYLEDITDLDYELQSRWEFPEDPLYHTYQYYLSGCTCGKLDNFELLGTGFHWVDMGCIYHGKS